MKIYSKTVTCERFIYEDGEFCCQASIVMELLEELEDTQAGFSVVLIDDPKIGNYLESKSVCTKGTRGSYYRANGFDDFKKAFSEMYYSLSR